MKNPDKIKINSNSSIKEALQIINSGAMKIAVLVNESGKLLGTITDGDIRRGLLNGIAMDEKAEKVSNKDPLVCGVNESREKILQKALARKVYQIPIVDNNNYLIGIEELDELISKEKKTNKVVLMAGGMGTRLGELTKNTPKPMLHVGDRPILETIIENFIKSGFTDIILSVNHLSHVIENYFGDGSRHGANITYVHEKKRLGTAGALDIIREQLNEPFFVMNGDILTNINFEHLYDFHISHESTATMCVREYDFQVPYGTVNIENGKILSIDEKPIHKFFVSAGIYMLSPESLKYVPQDTFFDMPTLFEKIIADNKNSVSFPMREYWLDVGQKKDYEKANIEFSEYF